MSRSNAVVISTADLKAWGRMPYYEECAGRAQHVLMKDLALNDKVLFVSHRWQDAPNNLADDDACSQYQVIMAYLLGCKEGQSITHVWLDLACINQDRGSLEGLKQFLVKLDNIGTAITCSHVVVVVPRLEQQQGGKPLYFSDLKEYTERGWCLFEIITALSMRCRIVLGLVCGAPADARFEVMQPGPAPGELTLAKLGEDRKAQRQTTTDSSLQRTAARALEALRKSGGGATALLDQAAACWESAVDPAALLEEMHRALDVDLEEKDTSARHQQLEAATMTSQLTPRYSVLPQAGKAIGKLLPHFTAERDREVVVRLLINLLVLVRTAFAAVAPRGPEALRELVAAELDVDPSEDRLTLEGKDLLPCEAAPLVGALVAELARRDAAGEGLAGRPLEVLLGRNPLGPQGAKALRAAAGRLPPLAALDLRDSGLGIAGALDLAGALADCPSFGGRLETLLLWDCGLGDEGAQALAGALPACPKLKALDLRWNGLGEETQAAVRAAWVVPLPDGTARDEDYLELDEEREVEEEEDA